MNRIGKFKITREALETGGASEIMKLVSPLTVNYNRSTGLYEFLAISAHFEPTDEEDPIPEYNIKISIQRPKVEFKKIE